MIYRQLPTFVTRTYRGGAQIRRFLGDSQAADDFMPEDWITSFKEAKNRIYIENEGISRVELNGVTSLITDAVAAECFGEGRTDPGVLIKFLDSAERLGIQVHPTKTFAKRIFKSDYGKTESWYILGTRKDACIYIGFKEGISRAEWKHLYDTQNIPAMLDRMHRFEVKEGDVILVTGGTPHAIGAGCFLLEVQEPTDYTMRVEKVTVAGEELTPMQIHYGAGEDALIDCFEYDGLTREQAESRFFKKSAMAENGVKPLITYDDTPFFNYTRYCGGHHVFAYPYYCTLISLKTRGRIIEGNDEIVLKAGDRFFIPDNTKFEIEDADAIICLPPLKK